jgi:hypothetical protein
MLNDPTTNPPPGQTPPSGDPPGQTPPPAGAGLTPQTLHKTPISSLPPDTQEYIRLLREENKKAREALDTEAAAKTAAEEARLKQQGEYKALAEMHEAKVKQLEPVSVKYASLAELVNGQIEATIKDWPPEVKAFDPGKDAPVEARYAWVTKSGPLIEKLVGQARGLAPGNAPNPRPAGGGNVGNSPDVAELKRRYVERTGKIF